MKTFLRSYESSFDNEVKNLSTLGNSQAQGVVQYLGSFRHAGWPAHHHAGSSTDPGDTMSCHILLELGNGDLLDLFGQAVPAHHTEIKSFWLDLFRVAKAVEELHELKIKVEETSETVFAYVASILQRHRQQLTRIGSMAISNQKTSSLSKANSNWLIWAFQE
jgi:hypothetical protein